MSLTAWEFIVVVAVVAVIALVVVVVEVLVAIINMIVVAGLLGVDALADVSANTFAVVVADSDFPV